ncbi:MAG TPA: DNA recombination protein RmuC [Thermoanaerobaculia bacterium]|nr:DNA recombination protein RmuC [Thermoanaerobaculia bacterium]
MVIWIVVAGVVGVVVGAVGAWLAASARIANQKQIEETFTALAQRAFVSVSETLAQQNKQQVDGSLETKKVEIEGLLKPLREMLDTYRGELLQSESARTASYGGLQEQIRSLLSAQQSAQREAARLANALQSPAVRGSWGEISLRRCVELAGMTEYCDFVVQQTIEGEDGRRLRPDMLVRLPNNRVIAVDSKAPITDYNAAAQTVEEEQRRTLLGSHARNIRRHIDALSRKEYQAAIDDTLDFVVLFVPGDQFVPNDGEIFEYAAQRKVVVASPTTLLPLLRAVEKGWKAEKTEENAKRMHEAGVELFNRFVRIMELLSEVGSRLGKTVEKYNEAIRSIDARLWPKGEEMQRMAGSGKELASLDQLEAVPLQSSKLRLTMQSDEEGEVIPINNG